MDCRQTEHQLIDLIDRRLKSTQELLVHAHLESCESCRQSLERWQTILPTLRDQIPESLPPLSLRRMEIAIERSLADPKRIPSRPNLRWQRRNGWFTLFGTSVVAALAILWFVNWPGSASKEERVYGQLTRSEGSTWVNAKPRAAGAPLAAGELIEVGPSSVTHLSLGRSSHATLTGPGRLFLLGNAQALRMRLLGGTLTVAVERRAIGESFIVETADGRVEVRGTRFTVKTMQEGSMVRVEEGKVMAFRKDSSDPYPVTAGESFWLSNEPVAQVPIVEPRVAGTTTVPAGLPSSPDPSKKCEATIANVRAALAKGNTARAVSLTERNLVASGNNDGFCQHELGYLRAESLRVAGRLDEAILAYRRLNRPFAPPAMRQNALFAAAQLELRMGRPKSALRDFEAALAVSPRGVLREDALAAALDAALAAGAMNQAENVAKRYLSAFPNGAAKERAQAIINE